LYFDNFVLEKELNFSRMLDSAELHELHMHDSLEINVLQENDSRFRLIHRNYSGKPGDVFLFRPYEPHWNDSASSERPIRWIMVLFSPSVVRLIPGGYRLLLPFYAMNDLTPLIPAESPYAKAIQQAAESAVREQELQHEGWEAMQFKHFIDILVNMHRFTMEQAGSRYEEMIDSGLLNAIRFMLEHITENIGMDAVATIAGKKRSLFYRQFRAVVGVTPGAFINRLRLQIADHLVATTSRTITDIALECGFQSVQYFNKVYKLRYGIAPGSRRK
jgi:AraC-like DNA-binding protein